MERVKNERIDWIDTLRGLAMVIVVIGHMNFKSSGFIKTYIYSFHMPLFFAISGMTFALSRKQLAFKEFFIKKAKGLLIPYFAWNFLALPYWWYNTRILRNSNTPVTKAIKGIFYCNENYYSGPTNATWFLATLFLVEIIFFILVKWAGNDKKILAVFMLVCAVLGYQANFSKKMPPWHIDAIPTALFFFYLGYIFLKNYSFLKESVIKFKYRRIMWLIVMLLCAYSGYWFAKNNVRTSMVLSTYGDIYYYYLGAILTSIAVVMLVLSVPNIFPLKFIGQNTIPYVALHCMVLRTLTYYNETTSDFTYNHQWLCALLIIVLLIPVCLLVNRFFPALSGKIKKRDNKNN